MSEEEKQGPAESEATESTAPQDAPPTARDEQPIALIGEMRACRGAARALARKQVQVRVLCADEAEATALRNGLSEGSGALTSDELACVLPKVCRIESDSDLTALLEGVNGVALLSPVELEGRSWRPATHLDDVRAVVEAVANRRIARVVYLSSVAASAKWPIRCLREAIEAEKLISECGSTDFLLRTGPLIGHGDPWLTRAFRKSATTLPLAVIRGYGDTPFQPIHEDDLGTCVARCLTAPSGELRPGVYALASTPPAHMLNLLERASKLLGRMPKARLHVPLFLLSIGVRFQKLFNRDRAWEYADRVGMLRCALVAEKNDMETLLGPTCSRRPLANALEEAAAALGLTPAPATTSQS